jgi:hypothetical protein
MHLIQGEGLEETLKEELEMQGHQRRRFEKVLCKKVSRSAISPPPGIRIEWGHVVLTSQYATRSSVR